MIEVRTPSSLRGFIERFCMSTAVYPGSLDPVTSGHVAAIADAADAFGHVIVAIGANPSKSYLFSLAEREALARQATRHIAGVTVTSFSGLLVHYLARNNLNIVIRGLRNVQDLNDATLQDTIGWQQQLAKDIRVFYVPARAGQQFTSSTSLKAVLKEQGNATHMAPMSTIQATQARMLGQYIYGVTGTSGAGKSYICQSFKEIAERRGIKLTHIDLDRIAHEILGDAEEPLYQKARAEVVSTFGSEVLSEDGTINRKALGQIVFEDPARLAELNAILHEPIFFNLNDRLRGESGIFVVDAALLAETGRTHLAHNNILLVDAPFETRAERLGLRDQLSAEQIERRTTSQYSAEVKEVAIREAIAAATSGTLDRVMNDEGFSGQDIERAFDTMLSRIDIYGELRITSFLKQLGVEQAAAVYQTIRGFYSGHERLYHCLSHIVDGLDKLPGFAAFLAAPAAVTLAWIFHDAVYDARRSDNEEQSAKLMLKLGQSWGIDAALLAEAEGLIRVTQHGVVEAVTADQKWMVDLDMSILGSEAAAFAQYERDVRREYGFIPQAEWGRGRSDFLRGLKQPLFHNEYFMGLYGAGAARNIAASLAILAGN